MKALIACLVVAGTLTVAPRKAGADVDEARRAQIVAKIGRTSVTLGELEARLATVPRFQLATFGSTPAEIRTRFLQAVIVPEVLYALAAEDKHIDQSPLGRHEKNRVLSDGTIRAVKATVPKARDLSDDAVKRYFDDHKSRFEGEEGILVWRILCATREEALTVLELAKKTPTVDAFGTLARERSIDKATNLRNGNVGFLASDGTSNEAGLKVDPELVKAASQVKDGEFVKDPVKEGEHFAVVWRRGTRAATHHSKESVEPQIRDAMVREAGEKEVEKTLADLKTKNVKDVDLLLLNLVDIRRVDGAVLPKHRGDAGSPSVRPAK